MFTQKEGLPVLKNLLTFLTSSDREDHSNLNILLSFCRHCGDDFAGLVPRKVRQLAEKHHYAVPSSDVCGDSLSTLARFPVGFISAIWWGSYVLFFFPTSVLV